MADMRHVPGLNLGGFIIPGANNLPDLYVSANDPADWATLQIAARQPAAAPAVATAAAASNPVTQFTSGILPDWLTSPDYLANLGKGLAVKVIGILLGLAVVIFGLYYFTKD